MAGETCTSPTNGNRIGTTRRGKKTGVSQEAAYLSVAYTPWVRWVNGKIRCMCRICRVNWVAVGSKIPRRCGNPKYRHIWWYKVPPKKAPKPIPNPVLEQALDLLKTDFALHCKRLRVRMKKTQRQFAGLLGVTVVTVSRMESGTHSPQRRHLQKFMELQNQFDSRKSNAGLKRKNNGR